MEAIRRGDFSCNQCEALMINGVFCHETGCPNIERRYNPTTKEWEKPPEPWEEDFDGEWNQIYHSSPEEYRKYYGMGQ